MASGFGTRSAMVIFLSSIRSRRPIRRRQILCIHLMGVRTLIAAHERRASTNLYQIVRRYYDNLPAEMKPEVGTSNAEELIFDKLDSGYLITTASGEGTGRSATVQLMHLSELAYF